jgi:transcriptional regulator with XRE-family HTH domain
MFNLSINKALFLNLREGKMSEGKRIKELRDTLDLSQKDFGAKIHRVKGTISQIEHDKYPIEASLRQSIAHVFNVREEWLRDGTGEMFNNKTYNAFSCDKQRKGVMLKEMNSADPDVEKNKISDAVKMCIDVMESGTSYADALYHNLVHFDRAVKSEISQKQYQEDLQIVNDKYLELEKALSEMRTRMDEVIDENKKLRDEKKFLQGLNGDCAPTALTVDHVAPTGTDDTET